jgi:aarF domain-containing kinase
MCADKAQAVATLCIIDYKWTFWKAYTSPEQKHRAYSECHTRSAARVVEALKINGGIFIKLGQHISSIQLLPLEWTSAFRPLQDQCIPTPYSKIEAMFLRDTGKSLDELFEEFDPEPVGVASLAQVHIAKDKKTGRRVAVKIQHPHLEEFAKIE